MSDLPATETVVGTCRLCGRTIYAAMDIVCMGRSEHVDGIEHRTACPEFIAVELEPKRG